MDLLHRKHSSRRFGQPLSHVVVDRLLTLPRKIIDQFECLDFPVSDVVPRLILRRRTAPRPVSCPPGRSCPTDRSV